VTGATGLTDLVGARPDVLVVSHAAVAPSGVWVVEASDASGRVTVGRPIGGERRLTVGGDDASELLAALAWRVRSIGEVLDDDVPVHGAVCFSRANLPLLRTAKLDGFPLLSPKGLAKRLAASAALDAPRRQAVADRLRERLA
jgi:hypothetical protein